MQENVRFGSNVTRNQPVLLEKFLSGPEINWNLLIFAQIYVFWLKNDRKSFMCACKASILFQK
jgi:hypothetical protein